MLLLEQTKLLSDPHQPSVAQMKWKKETNKQQMVIISNESMSNSTLITLLSDCNVLVSHNAEVEM